MTAAPHHLGNSVFEVQSTFRAIMQAISRPGSLQSIEGLKDVPAPLSGEAAAIALALLDHDTPVWLDPKLAQPDIIAWLRFQTGAPFVSEPGVAAFALIGDAAMLPPLNAFDQGSAEYPDCSTTIVVQVANFAEGEALILTGPGIRDSHPFRAAPSPKDMAERIATNRSQFPRGVDLLYAGPSQIAAIPRSVRLKRG